MSFIYFEIICFFVALVLAGIFAFLETSFTALRLFKVKELQSSVARYTTLFSVWENNPQRILITILITNNFAHVLCSAVLTDIMQYSFGGGVGLMIGIPLATVLILIFGEIIPKTLAKAQSERLFKSLLWLVYILFYLLYPLVTFLIGMAGFVSRAFGVNTDKHHEISEKEIEFLIDYSDEKGLMETGKTEMLQNIFDLGHKFVYEIIVPKSDIILIDEKATLEQSLAIFSEHRFSRLPVYEGDEDNIIGLLYQRDVIALISRSKHTAIKDLVRPVSFIPEVKRINQLLKEFLETRTHMAIVIDEYGAVEGLVTLEDVLEEIVGEIRDEDEKVYTEVVPLEKGGWLIDARMSLDKLGETLGINFDVEESVTLAGFLSEMLQHLPRKGERLVYEGYCFQIQQANRRRVFQVLVFKQDALQDGEEEKTGES